MQLREWNYIDCVHAQHDIFLNTERFAPNDRTE